MKTALSLTYVGILTNILQKHYESSLPIKKNSSTE